MKKISIIIPCYNEEQSIPFFYKEITKITQKLKYNFEFIFVNDGSKDNTFLELKQLDNVELNLNGEVNGTIKNEGNSISRE